MQRRFSSSLLPLLVSFLAMPMLLASCGGGGNDDNGSGGTTNGNAVVAGADISWGARSRNFAGPASALSARIVFVGGSATSTDVATVVDRRDDPAAYTSTYGSTARVRTGPVTIRVEFYAGKGATGARVAIAETGAILKPDGTLARASGGNLEITNFESDLATLSILAPANLEVGASVTLGVAVSNRAGQIVAISPGSVTFQSYSTAFTLTADGVVRGVRAGADQVVATLDGLSSVATIQVVPSNSDAVQVVNQDTNDLAFSAARGKLIATTPGTAASPNRLIEIDPGTGAIGNAYQVGSAPDAIALSANGAIAYVSVTGAGTVRRVDLTTGDVGAPVSLGGNADGSFSAIDLSVSPVDPESVAVSFTNDQFQIGVGVIRNGVLLPNVTSDYYQNYVIAFNALGTEVYGFDTYSSGAELTRNTVDANGVTATGQRGSVIGGRTFFVAGNRIFGLDGRVVDAATFAATGRFQFNEGVSYIAAFALDASRGRAYFLAEATGSSDLLLLTYDTETYGQISSKTLPVSRPPLTRRPTRLVVTSADRLAYSTGDGRILLIDTAKL